MSGAVDLLLGQLTAQPNELGQPGAKRLSTRTHARLGGGTVRQTLVSGTTPAAAPRHAAAPHGHAPHDSPCADGRADAPTPGPTDGPNTKTDAEPVASTKELDAVADPFPQTDAAAHAQFRADLRAVAGTVPKPLSSPDAAADAHAPDGGTHPETDSGKVSFLLHGRRRRGHEDADHVLELAVCLRLRRRHAAAFVR